MKKSKQSNNKIILDLDKNNNARLRLKTLGKIELKYVSFPDFQKFSMILAEKTINNKEFVQKILYNQLIKPKISFSKFKQLSDENLIKISKAFVKKETHTFQYFNNTGDFFKDFRLAIKTYEEKETARIEKSLEQIIKSAQKTLNSFNQRYASVIQYRIDDLLQPSLTRLTKQIRETQVRLAESFKPIIEQYHSRIRILAESLKPQIDFWQKWVEQNKFIFENIGKFWADFQKKYQIAEQKAIRVLKKYKWFITPSLLKSFVFKIMQLDEKKGRQDKAINKLYVDYFSSNNWRNLEIMANNWRNKPLFKKRNIILRDCVKVLKQLRGKKINETNVTLPTLITQIDGILTDYLVSKNIQWDRAYDDYVQHGKVKKVGRKSQFKRNRSKVLTTQFDELANDIFLNILFQKSQKGQPLKTPFNFNRHKIMHGESVKYGRKVYLIRAFLTLDFLAHLK